MTPQQVQDEARKWLFVPHIPCGRTRRGIDCIGLVAVVATAFGIPYEDRANYSQLPDPQREMLEVFPRYLDQFPVSRATPGMIGVFVASRHRLMHQRPAHVGFLSEKDGIPHVIHVRTDIGVTEQVWDRQWHTQDIRITALFAFKGLEL